jgi:hypothetical protein
MKVYRGTIATGKTRRKSAVDAVASGKSFMCFINAICYVGGLVGITVGVFLYYMSLVRDIRNTSRQIEITRQDIEETARALQTLNNEQARLKDHRYIQQKVRQFRLPLAVVEHRQIMQKNMEILTPLQASRVTMPRTPVAVAGNLPRTQHYSGRF